jgi:hypothetical protein
MNWAFKVFFYTLALTSLVQTTNAEVTSKSDNGFNLRISGEVPVGRARAYEQFLAIGNWWNASHTYFGDASGLYLEPRAGGCFCEKSGDREVLHMLVTQVRPGEEIRMVGGLGPLQMMGINGGMSWTFDAVDDSTTRITQTYNVSGYMEGGLGQLADVVDGVQTGQLNALVASLTPDMPVDN